MAEKKSLATYESIMRDLKAKKYAPVYILMGDESYYIDKIADYIADNVLEPDDRDFNQTIIFEGPHQYALQSSSTTWDQ